MKETLSLFIEDNDRIERSIQNLHLKYPDDLVNNDLELDMKDLPALKTNIIKQSAKRNRFSNITLLQQLEDLLNLIFLFQIYSQISFH